MHGGVHPLEVGAPYGRRVARDGVRRKQLLDHDIIRLTSYAPQPPDSVPLYMVSHAGLAGAGQQLAVEGPSGPRWRPIICLRQPLWKVSSCAPCSSLRAHDSAAPYMSRGSTRDL